MNINEKKKIIELYEGRLDKYGYNHKTIGWGDLESQQLRFEILSKIANLDNSSICDLGCGFGDLYKYLNNMYDKIDYLGIDISEKLILEAKKQYPDVKFKVDDILEHKVSEKYDYVLSSGALTYKTENHEMFIENMLKAMVNMANKGVAVNFLSSYVDYKLEKNFHFSPEAAFSMAKKIVKNVVIRHDYPLYEFTLYMYV